MDYNPKLSEVDMQKQNLYLCIVTEGNNMIVACGLYSGHTSQQAAEKAEVQFLQAGRMTDETWCHVVDVRDIMSALRTDTFESNVTNQTIASKTQVH